MNHQAKLFRSIKTIADFDDVMVHQAKDYFHDYVEKGIILTLDFEAYKWQTTNEYANISFLFNINRFQYKRVYESLFGWHRVRNLCGLPKKLYCPINGSTCADISAKFFA